MRNYHSYRIIIDYTYTGHFPSDPRKWDWHELLEMEASETVSLVDVQDIETPEGHKEDLKDV